VWTPFRAAGLDETMAFSAAMLAGGLAQMLAQWPQLRREGYRHSWRFNPCNPALREVLFLMGPGTIGVAAAQINLFVNTLLASEVNEVPSVLRYAFLLMYLPIGIFGVSVATATIPDISRQAAEGALKTMGATVSWAIRLMLVLSVPATVGLIVLAEPITRLIFERGEFDARSTMMTATALAFYAPGIVGYSIVKIASPGFYALRDARTPMFISLVTIGANLGLSIWLNSLIEYRGLALGTALAALVNAGLLLAFLSRRIGGLEAGRILNTFVRILVASAVMGAAAHYAHDWLRSTIPGDTLVIRMVQVFAAIGIGLIVFAAAAFALRVHEVGAAFQRVLGRVRR
jgi:putative peptidoglycan lipid II flippase